MTDHACKNCGADLSHRYKSAEYCHPCMHERQKKRSRDWFKQRYRTDPKFKQRKLEMHKKWLAEHPGYKKRIDHDYIQRYIHSHDPIPCQRWEVKPIMHLSNLAKLALMDCTTTQEARRLLDLAESEAQMLVSIGQANKPDPLQDIKQRATVVPAQEKPSKEPSNDLKEARRQNYVLAQKNQRLKQTVDELKGAPKPKRETDPNSTSVSLPQIKMLIQEWRKQQRAFNAIDLAQYFNISQYKASNYITRLWTRKSPSHWNWFEQNYIRAKDGKSYVYLPKDKSMEQRIKQRGHRTIAMGTASGRANKIKDIPASD